MARNSSRYRCEWQPGRAALEAVEIAERLHPHLGRQAVIDKLVLVGLSALQHRPWVPPALFGNDRDTWRLPPDLRLADESVPEIDPQITTKRG